ncbi:RING/U-box superfamily protein [Actinidia rufa]|uniref:RING-type E3 ubiquitin transferase n=1 Tax=Actinidia rufa TaxID=165716 RepID=A0A7J0DVP6_9ERIC|nr:RING/U-box superfamily protein [Actinidia rufa]
MDEYSGKRAGGGFVTPRKGSGLVLRGTAGSRDRDAQFCNRLGCNGRLNHTKSAQNGCSEKFKSSRSSINASNGKGIIGSSTRTYSTVTNKRKSLQALNNHSSQLETRSSEMSSIQDEPEASEHAPSTGRNQAGVESDLNDAESGKIRLKEVGSSNIAPHTKPPKVYRHKSVMGTRDTQLGSPVPLASESTSQGARNNTDASRYCLRNLRCKSIPDVVPSGGSSSESNLYRRKDVVKKKTPELATSSSGRVKKTSGLLSEDSRISASTNAIAIYDLGQSKRRPPNMDNGVGSVRTRRSIGGNSRMRIWNQENVNNLAPTELPVVIPHMPQPEIIIGLDDASSSNQFSAEASSSHSTSYSRPGSSGESLPGIMPVYPSELGTTRSLINLDGLRRYNIDGIAEVLLALERIEQNEELSYEQLLALETNLFLGSHGFYDQHRDMRLDIDNMSYEELLVLEEKMGIVSTALSEDSLSKCLERSIHQPMPCKEGSSGCSRDEDDIKCSICQEEYVFGDEVGRLECEHGYHVVCINQWLRLKNWCPICKASAAPSQSSSPH